MADIQEFQEMIGTWGAAFGFPEETVSYLRGQKDVKRACLYMELCFNGITTAQIEEMEQHNLDENQIRDKRKHILAERFRRRDDLANDLAVMKQKMTRTIEDTEKVRKYYEEKLEASWEAERAALKSVIEGKDETLREYRHRMQALDRLLEKAKENQRDVTVPPAKGFFFGRRQARGEPHTSGTDNANQNASDKQRAFEEAQFRDNILRNPAYTKEQKDFLLSSFREGTSYWALMEVAFPDLDVAFMKALLERSGEKAT